MDINQIPCPACGKCNIKRYNLYDEFRFNHISKIHCTDCNLVGYGDNSKEAYTNMQINSWINKISTGLNNLANAINTLNNNKNTQED